MGGLGERHRQGKSLKVCVCSHSFFPPSVTTALSTEICNRPNRDLGRGCSQLLAFLEFPLCEQLEHKHGLLAFIFRLEVYPAFLFFLATGGVYHPVSDATVQVCMPELCSCSLTWGGWGAVGQTSPSGGSRLLHSCAPSENVVVEGLVQGNHKYLINSLLLLQLLEPFPSPKGALLDKRKHSQPPDHEWEGSLQPCLVLPSPAVSCWAYNSTTQQLVVGRTGTLFPPPKNTFMRSLSDKNRWGTW